MSISNNELYIYKDGAKAAKAKIERSSTSSKDVIISFDIPEGLTEKGIYTLTINEGIIKDQLEETYNPSFHPDLQSWIRKRTRSFRNLLGC